jgi:hypothetical protein
LVKLNIAQGPGLILRALLITMRRFVRVQIGRPAKH